jgi:hypothetical protein
MPWVVRNTIVLDRFVGISTQGGYALASKDNEESRATLGYAGHVAETVALNTLHVFDLVRYESLKEDWQIFLQAEGMDRLISPIDPASLYLIMVLALVGIAAQFGPLPSPRAPPFIWSFPLVLLLPAVFFWGLQRYRAPADPFLVMLAAVGVVAMVDQLLARRAADPTQLPAPVRQR